MSAYKNQTLNKLENIKNMFTFVTNGEVITHNFV